MVSTVGQTWPAGRGKNDVGGVKLHGAGDALRRDSWSPLISCSFEIEINPQNHDNLAPLPSLDQKPTHEPTQQDGCATFSISPNRIGLLEIRNIEFLGKESYFLQGRYHSIQKVQYGGNSPRVLRLTSGACEWYAR